MATWAMCVTPCQSLLLSLCRNINTACNLVLQVETTLHMYCTGATEGIRVLQQELSSLCDRKSIHCGLHSLCTLASALPPDHDKGPQSLWRSGMDYHSYGSSIEYSRTREFLTRSSESPSGWNPHGSKYGISYLKYSQVRIQVTHECTCVQP